MAPKLLALNTQVSSRANRISQSLQFINFKEERLRWDEEREVGAWNKKEALSLVATQEPKAEAPKTLQRCTTLLLIYHPKMRNHTFLWIKSLAS